MSNIKLFNTAQINQNLYNLVEEYSNGVTQSVIDYEPIDQSPDRDDIVMKERTYRDVTQIASGVQLDITIDVDYAELRNTTNNLNPGTKNFIEKGLKNAMNVYESIDYNRIL